MVDRERVAALADQVFEKRWFVFDVNDERVKVKAARSRLDHTMELTWNPAATPEAVLRELLGMRDVLIDEVMSGASA